MVEPRLTSSIRPAASSFADEMRAMRATLASIELNIQRVAEAIECTHRTVSAQLESFDQRLSERILSNQIARLEACDDPPLGGNGTPDIPQFRRDVAQLRVDFEHRGEQRDLTPLVLRLAALEAKSGIRFELLLAR